MRKGTSELPARDVEEYLQRVPESAQTALEKLRKMIKSAAPKAEEAISYGIPTFKLNGALVGFGAAKKHIGFYVMSYAVMETFKKELEPYDISTATIRFPFDAPLPAGLIKKIVQARVKENNAILLVKKK